MSELRNMSIEELAFRADISIRAVRSTAIEELVRRAKEAEQQDWQPIETAPIKKYKEDPYFRFKCLIFPYYGDVAEGIFDYTSTGKPRWRGGSGYVVSPTHWRPLPKPPKE